MNAPPIYIVVQCHGDGYGHNSYDYVAWFFDEADADDYVEKNRGNGSPWLSVYEVPAGSPMKRRDRW